MIKGPGDRSLYAIGDLPLLPRGRRLCLHGAEASALKLAQVDL